MINPRAMRRISFWNSSISFELSGDLSQSEFPCKNRRLRAFFEKEARCAGIYTRTI